MGRDRTGTVRRWTGLAVAAVVAAGALAACDPRSVPPTPGSAQAATTAPRTPATPVAGPPTAVPAGGCLPKRPHAAGTSNQTVTVGGVKRTYLLHVPASYTGKRAVPLVATFHGLGSGAGEQLVYSRFDKLSDKEGFVVVSPQGLGSPARWDILTPATTPTSDAAFIAAMLSQVRSTLCLDPARQYASGISNGSALSFAAACAGTFGFAAYGGVSAAFWNEDRCQGAPPAAVIYFHGTADQVVPIDGGSALGIPVKPARTSIEAVAAHDGCRLARPKVQVTAHVTRASWRGCRGSAAIDWYIVEGGGHTWPGSTGFPTAHLGPTTSEIDATALMWSFFLAHPRT